MITTPELSKQVAELKRVRDVKRLSELILNTNKAEKIELVAKALGDIGTREAKAELLMHLVSLNPKNDLIWPYVLPLLEQEDVPQLLDFERYATWNARMSAKYKLPPKAQALLVDYVSTHVEDAPGETLRRLVTSRYSEVSRITLDLLLENDSVEIRKTLKAVMGGIGDGRTLNTRAMLAFEELLKRTPAENRKKLLTEAFGSYSVSVSRKAGEILNQRNHRYFLRIVREKSWLNAVDIQVLMQDAGEASVARIIEEERKFVPRVTLRNRPSKAAREKMRAMACSLEAIGTPEAQKALKSLAKKWSRIVS